MYNFENTNEAIDFGKTATPQDISNLRLYRSMYAANCFKSKGLGNLNEAMEHAVNGQFCREAIESYNDRLNADVNAMNDMGMEQQYNIDTLRTITDYLDELTAALADYNKGE